MLSVSAYVVTSVRTFKCSTNRSFFTVRERDAHVNTAAQAPSGLEKPNECSRLKHVRPFSIIPHLRRQGLLTGSARKPDCATQLFSVTPFANLRCVFFYVRIPYSSKPSTHSKSKSFGLQFSSVSAAQIHRPPAKEFRERTIREKKELIVSRTWWFFSVQLNPTSEMKCFIGLFVFASVLAAGKFEVAISLTVPLAWKWF